MSSSSTPAARPPPTSTPTPSSPSPASPPPAMLSLRPCLVCKNRRVKCNKELPSCDNCIKRKNRCKYPDMNGRKLNDPVNRRALKAYERSPEEVKRLVQVPDGYAKGKEDEEEPQEEEKEEESADGAVDEDLPSLKPRTPTPTLPEVDHPSPVSPLQQFRQTSPSPSPLPPPLRPTPSYPSFPRAPPSQPQRHLRAAREALCKAIVSGTDAPLDEVKLDGVDVTSLFVELLKSDASFKDVSTPLLSLFSTASSTSSLPAPSQPIAHTALSAYFVTHEPCLQLFGSDASKQAFQTLCVELWKGVEGEKARVRPRGWKSLYFAAVATGTMALTDDEAKRVGLGSDREKWAQGWAEEAARALPADDFPTYPTLEGLRAALLLLHFELAGYSSGTPDVAKVVSVLPALRSVAFELDLHCELTVPGEGDEERRGLWWRLFELDGAWSLLVNSRSTLHPLSYSCRLTAVASDPTPASSPPDETPSRPRSSPLLAALVVASSLTHLLNSSPYPPTLLDLSIIQDRYSVVSSSFEGIEVEPMAKLLLHATFFRLSAAREEAGESLVDLSEWERQIDTIIDDVFLLPSCNRFQPLLALTTYLHALVLVSLRLRASPSPVLVGRVHRLFDSLKKASWPVALHRTLKRGVLVVEHLLPA